MLEPRRGKCNATTGTGRICGAEPLPGTTRCGAHGGGNQMLSGLRESLYTKRLRQSFKEPEDQRLFEEMPKGTDLSEEIRLARMRVTKYQEMLERGEEWIWTGQPENKPLASQIADDGTANVDKYQAKAISVHDLLRESLESLRKLAHTQDAIHPGSDIGGNLRLTITLAGTKKPPLPIPDLTNDPTATRLLPARDTTIDVEGMRPDRSSSGYDGDDE